MSLTLTYLLFNWKQDAHPEGVRVELGALNLLTGPTGSGKSAVYEAAQIVTTGAVSDYLGRDDVKDARMLWRSKPPGASSLFVEGGLSNGDVLRWEQARMTGKPVWTLNGVPIEAPPVAVVRTVSELRANLFGSSAKAEKWLDRTLRIQIARVIANACAPVKNKDGTTTTLPDEAIEAIRAVADGATSASDVTEALDRLANEAKAQAKAASNVAVELEHEAGVPPTDDELAKAQAALDAAWTTLRSANAERVTAQTIGQIASRMRVAKTALAALPVVPDTIARDVAFARTMIHTVTLVEQTYPGAPLCPCCKQGVEVGRLAARKAGLEKFVATNQGAANSLAERQRLLKVIEGTGAEAMRVKNASPEVFALILSGAWSDPVEGAEVAHRNAQALLTGLQARRVGAGAPSMAGRNAVEAEQRAVNLKLASDAVKNAQKKLVAKATDAFEKATARRFPASAGEVAITLRPQVQLGVKKGKAVGAPSGGQESLLLLAMAMTLAEAEAASPMAAGEDALRLVVMEDAGMDAGMYAELAALLGGWESGQAFVPATVPVRPPAGWNVISLWPEGSEGAKIMDGPTEVPKAPTTEAPKAPATEAPPKLALAPNPPPAAVTVPPAPAPATEAALFNEPAPAPAPAPVVGAAEFEAMFESFAEATDGDAREPDATEDRPTNGSGKPLSALEQSAAEALAAFSELGID